MTIRLRLILLAAGLLVAVVILAISVSLTFESVRIGGPAQRGIVVAKDLMADIAPPSATLLPAYAEVLRLLDEPNPDVRRQGLAGIAVLESDYHRRISWWSDHLPTGELRTAIVEASALPADAFFRAVRERFAPAILASDRITARRLANGDLRTLYTTHEQAISMALDLGRRYAADIEKAAVDQTAQRLWILAAIGVLVTLLVWAWLAWTTRTINAAVTRLSADMDRIAKGDLSVRCAIRGGDEFSTLGLAINQTVENLAGTVQLVRERSVGLAGTSNDLVRVGSEVAGLAADNQRRTASATTQADGLITAVASVAQAASGLDAAAQDIAQNLQASSETIHEAVSLAKRTDGLVTGLGASSKEIGAVVTEIAAIAGSTRLLALNAAIEAASAGAAGNGFAVVANEVKSLAQQTGQATEAIAKRVELIRQATEDAAAGMRQMGEIIARIEARHSSIAAAVDEQTATTSVISEDLGRITDQGQEIRQELALVLGAADQVFDQSEKVRVAAQSLDGAAGALTGVVAHLHLSSPDTVLTNSSSMG